LFLSLCCCINAAHVYALEPSQVLVIANRFVSDSVDLARYYMEKRGIPQENLLKITTTENETCKREVYEKEIAAPVRKAVLKNKQIKVLVTVYGVPLKVNQPALTNKENKQLKQLTGQRKQLKTDLDGLEKDDTEQSKALQQQLADLDKQIKTLRKEDHAAAVDSELALVLNEDYDLKFWLLNPYFVGNQQKSLPIGRGDVLMVSRLDGPSLQIVKRIIDDSLAAEEQGLSGKSYFDAKNSRTKKKQLKAAEFYDQSLHLAADLVRNRQTMPVVVDETRELFQPGEAPDAALYCGWYSYGKYIDAFDWVPGAVGYHMASVECATLRPKGHKQIWCKRMLEDGVAAVVGPVGEPYLQAFPVPEAFFSFLTDGYYNLVESYFLSLPFLSWKMILVGDPLYRPFKKQQTSSRNQ